MRKLVLFLALVMVVSLSGLSAQTAQNELHLKGKVLDSTQASFPGAFIKVFRGTDEPKAGTAPLKEGVSSDVGDFDIALPAGQYRIQVGAPDFNTFSQAVQLTATMAPLSVVLTVKELEGVTIDVNANNGEVGVDPNDSLTTDVIMGDALLDLPESEEDLLEYLTNLALARGGVEGELQINIDDFRLEGGRLPTRAEIAEIRIVNTSFSADGNSSGPRIEIVTRPGTGNWTGNAGFTFNDESLNAAAPLTDRKPASQSRNFNVGVRGPILPGRITSTIDVRNQQSESESNALRAVGINGPINEGVSRLNNSRSLSFRPTLTINSKNTLNGQFTYSTNRSDNSGVGNLVLPERATDSRGHNWNMQLSGRTTVSNRFQNTIRFRVQQNNSSNVPVLSARAINVTQSFQGGGAPNHSENKSQDFLFGNQFRWQRGTITFTGDFEVNRRMTDNASRNNYLGTYTFSSLHDYCYAEATVNGSFNGSECLKTKGLIDAAAALGESPYFVTVNPVTKAETRIPITGTPTQFTMTGGDPGLRVAQAELATYLQGDWRINTRTQLQFGARYQVQEHMRDYNNIAPTVGINYQLNTTPGWQTVLRFGGRLNYSIFNMGSWESLLRGNGISRQTSVQLLSPSYPNPGITAEDLAANAGSFNPSSSLRLRADDYVAPYSISPTLTIDQTLPKAHRLSFSMGMNRGVHQNRNRNINAPFPGTRLDEEFIAQLNSRNTAERDAARALVDQMRPYFPLTSTITLQESTGKSLQKNYSIRYSTNNKGLWGNRFLIGGNVTWSQSWSEDDNNPFNPYDLTDEWGVSGRDRRLSTSLNLRFVPQEMTLTINPGWQAGRPYTITSGRDENGDGSSNDRAAGYKKNSERGPSTFTAINMSFRKTFRIGGTPRPAANNYAEPQRGGGGFGGGGGGGGGRGGATGGRTIEFSMSVNNLFNSTIKQGINGNLSSALFGQLTGGGSGRRITLSLNTNLGRLF
jgi:hypothetical protein